MDEIDSIGSSRIESNSGGDSEVQRTMLELLNQLDGFEATKNIKVIMATNRIDILDPALLRPGRIDRKIEFPAPDEKVSELMAWHTEGLYSFVIGALGYFENPFEENEFDKGHQLEENRRSHARSVWS